MTGQKVVCVDDKFPLGIEKFYNALPKENETYVVRGTTVGISLQGEEGELCVYLVGLQNPCSTTPPYRERGFKCERFRPLEEIQEENRARQEQSEPALL
ncbi:MAG: hypothetical protein SFY81_01290 [Verrucomicrobiota bacterium]|nr:hypothetical protein [Verrucomicrobiota bacterium]